LLFSEQAAKENLSLQISNAIQMVKLERDPHAAFALIIDGKALTHALNDDLKARFLELAINCASVICCRVSPKQKALVLFNPMKHVMYNLVNFDIYKNTIFAHCWLVFNTSGKLGLRKNESLLLISFMSCMLTFELMLFFTSVYLFIYLLLFCLGDKACEGRYR
jgi:hypothetical protein